MYSVAMPTRTMGGYHVHTLYGWSFSGAAGFFTPISTPWGSFGRAVYLKVNLQKETE